MATVMSGYAESGLTTAKFVRRRRSDGAWWNTSGAPTYEVYNVANIADYGIAATETGATGVYTASDPATTIDGDYLLVKAAGASLAVADLTAGVRWQDLVNAPPADDFTATMKTSLNAATPAVTVSDKTGFSLANGSFITATFGTCDLTSTMKASVNTEADTALSDWGKTGFSLANGSFVTATFGTCDFTATMKAATLARVTLVDTCSVNSDMRGTDNAALAATALSTVQWTNARAGYLDNINVGGPVASQADVQAINQSASKHLLIQTVGQYERPESGTTVYTVEVRTFNATTGAAVNADSTPTFTALGSVSGNLSANLGAPSNPATGVYRADYTVTNTDALEQIRMDVSATIAAATFSLSCYTQLADQVSVTWNATDASNLTAIFNKLPLNNIADETIVLAAVGSPMQAGSTVVLTDASLTTAKLGAFALAKTTNITGFNDITAASVWAVGTRRLSDATNLTSDGLTISQTQLAHLDADISSRTKPADTQAAVTLVATTTNLTNLPAAPTDWLDAASVKADAVTKIQSGLSTYAGGDTAGTTTLLSRVPAAVALAGSAPSWYAAPVDVSADIATIMASTNNLPADPADASDIAGAFAVLATHGDSAWATAAGFSTLTTADIDARLAAAGLAFSLSNGATMSQWAEGVICLVGAGKLSGALAGTPCSPVVRDLADSKDLFTVTADGIGNRTVSLWTP